MISRVISSSSHGNAIIYHGEILVDCGVSFKALKPYYKSLRLVLLTHEHGDHFKDSTIKKLAGERPTLNFMCGQHIYERVKQLGIKNVHLVEPSKVYQMGEYMIIPIKLYHNVENYGYRILKNDYKILHVTDTVSLEGISAKGYDLYAIEYNFDEETIQSVIDEKTARGEFSYEMDATQNHLSFQKADKFIEENKKETSEVLKLHISSRYLE